MAQRTLTFLVWLTAVLLIQAPPALAALDTDGDGITDAMETNGWSNKAGGPYFTNPSDADSDNDGLKDGEEQLFNTNPLSNQSPGIYVRYGSTFRTQKYYSWTKYGSQYIAHGEDPSKTVIVRRGTTLVVGGRPGAILQISKTIPSLTTLSASLNPNGTSWTIPIPKGGTVGKYTLKVTSGSWSKTLKLYVIFDIPTNLSAASAAAYVYADNVADDRDTYSVWFVTNPNTNSHLSPSYDYNASAYAFVTDQYKQYVFEGYVIDTINGKNNLNDAFTALAHKVDQVTRFDANVWKTTMETALHSYQNRNDCSRIANVAVGFLRSAGIASRVIVTDWKTITYDSSTEAWVGNTWLTVRAYKNGNEVKISNPIESGIYGPYTQYYFGHNKYTASSSSIISTMGPNWQWKEVKSGNHCGNHAGSVYKNWHLPEMGRESPPDNPGGISRAAGWLSMTIPYWGWPSEPSTESILSYPCGAQLAPEPGVPPPPERLPQTAQGKDPLLPALPNRLSPLLGMALGLGLWAGLRQGRCRRLRWGGAVAGMGLAGLSLALLLNASLRLQGQSQPKPARLGKVVASYGLDRNGNGRFDALVVEVQVQVQQPGAYTLIGHLNDSTPTPQTTGGYLASASTYTTLAAGSQVVRLEFDGQTIYTNGEDGSYSLDELWLSDQPFPEEVDLAQQAVDSQTPGYRTAAYSRDAFENGGARLSGRYGHTSLDANQDGYFDSLMVTTDLQVNTPGAYRVEAELADSQGQLVATAAWNGSGGPVSLSFQALLGDVTSYYLRHVQLYGAQGELIDSAEADTSSPGVYATGPLYNLGLGELPAAYASPRLLNVQAKAGASSVDFRGYDVIVNTAIAVEGDYRLEAWLEGSEGELFAWEVSEPVHLTPGLRDLTLSFKERQLKVLKAKGPYKLISLKVLFNSGYTVVDQIDVAYDPSVSAKQSSQNSRP